MTGFVLQALAAAGTSPSDPQVRAVLTALATVQQSSGAWIDFFGAEGNASSTALAVLGITAAGYDPTTSCWRDSVLPAKVGTPYANPDAWIRSQQQPDGHIASPYDIYGVNTLTTSQALEGLLRSWLPIVKAPSSSCTPPPAPPTVTGTTNGTATAGSQLTVSGSGFAPGATVTITLHSDLVVLGTTTADVHGEYSLTVIVPAGTEPGSHQIVATGIGPSGGQTFSLTSLTIAASVAPTAADAGAQAAATAVGGEVAARFTG